MTELLKTILLIIGGGGGILAIVKILLDAFSKNSIRSRNILINNMNYWKVEAEKARIRAEEKDKRIIELLEEIVNLKVRYSEKRSDFEDIPLIYAKLDDKARMINFTNLYSRVFIRPTGKNPFSYYGKTSLEFWGVEIGGEYTKHDLQVLESEKPFYGIESLIHEGKNYLEHYIVYKWISYSHGDEKFLNVLIIDDHELVKLFKQCEDAKQQHVPRRGL